MISSLKNLLVPVCTLFMAAAAENVAAIPEPKISEEFATANRVGCVANLGGYHFNLK